MKRLIAILFIIFVTSRNWAALPESGDRVIIGDCEYVLVRSGDWAEVTNNVQTCLATWQKLNETEAGRTAIHGKRGHTTITNGAITVEYADGWKRTEQIEQIETKSKVTRKSREIRPSRLEAVKRRREAALKTVREITVEMGASK